MDEHALFAIKFIHSFSCSEHIGWLRKQSWNTPRFDRNKVRQTDDLDSLNTIGEEKCNRKHYNDLAANTRFLIDALDDFAAFCDQAQAHDRFLCDYKQCTAAILLVERA